MLLVRAALAAALDNCRNNNIFRQGQALPLLLRTCRACHQPYTINKKPIAFFGFSLYNKLLKPVILTILNNVN